MTYPSVQDVAGLLDPGRRARPLVVALTPDLGEVLGPARVVGAARLSALVGAAGVLLRVACVGAGPDVLLAVMALQSTLLVADLGGATEVVRVLGPERRELALDVPAALHQDAAEPVLGPGEHNDVQA
ncbi:hypothetical protein PG988_000193 [Apiospora saccharicola]